MTDESIASTAVPPVDGAEAGGPDDACPGGSGGDGVPLASGAPPAAASSPSPLLHSSSPAFGGSNYNSSMPPSAIGSPILGAGSASLAALTNSLGGGGAGSGSGSGRWGSEAGDLSDLVSESGDSVDFQKTLHSDVDAARSLALLRRAWQLDPLLPQVFGPDTDTAQGGRSPGVRELSACLSVLVFSAGERIIRAGEEATFAALVLEGDVAAHVAPGVSVPLPAGSWVGEMALFERGPRSADISVGAGGAVLAVLSYEDLERLNQSAGQADLCHKLTMLLAMASIKKLRKMAPPPPPAASSSGAASPAIAPAPSPSHRSSNRASISGPLGLPLHASGGGGVGGVGPKKESLFVARLAKQSVALAEIEARQKAELASMKSLVVRREAEAHYAKENVKNRLAKLEGEARDALARAAEAQRKLGGERRKRGEVEAALARALAEKAEVALAIPAAEARATEAISQALAAEEARMVLESSAAAQVSALQSQLDRVSAQLLEHQHAVSESASASSETLLAAEALTAARDSLAQRVSTLTARVSQLDNEKGYAEFRIRTLQGRAEAAEEDAAAWKRKSGDYLDNYEKLLSKYRTDLAEIGAEKLSIAQSHRTFHKLVRLLALRSYVRNWKLRRALFNVHLVVSEMVVRRWEEQVDDQRRDAGLHWGARATMQTQGQQQGQGGAGPMSPGTNYATLATAAAAAAGNNNGLVDQSSLFAQLQSASNRTQQLHSILQAQQAAQAPAQQQQQQQAAQGSSSGSAQASHNGSPSALSRAGALGVGGTNPTPSASPSSATLSLLPPPLSPTLSPSTPASSGALALPYPPLGGGGGGGGGSSSSGAAAFAAALPYDAAALSVQSYTTPGETQHIPQEQLRAEKKRYLSALRSARDPPPSVFTLLQSIEDELVELRTPVESMAHRVRSLRAVLDSFFARNIQLTSRVLNTTRALEVATSNYESLRASVRARHAAEATTNPFSQHAMLEGSGGGGGAAGAGAMGGSASRRTPSLGAGPRLDDEKDGSILGSAGAGGAALSGSLSARGAGASFSSVFSSAAGGTLSAPSNGGGGGPSAPGSASASSSSSARRPSSSSGSIDWAALEVEKSSGYGVTRPLVRREARIAPGLGPRPPGAAGSAATGRRPSIMGGGAAAHSRSPGVPFVPHPPSSVAPSHAVGGSLFLPRV